MNDQVVEKKNKESLSEQYHNPEQTPETVLNNDWLAEYEARKMAERSAATLQLRDVCSQLETLGIQTVVVAYDGCGDSGCVEEVRFTPEDIQVGKAITTLIEDASYAFLPGGWEINDGSFGELAIDVAQRVITHEYNERYTDYTQETVTINLEDDQ